MPRVSLPTSAPHVQTPLQCKRLAMREHELGKVRRHGWPHPPKDRFLMVPPVFSVILACEPLSVSQVIFEVLTQTIGYIGDGPDHRRAWASLSYRHFERKGLMSRDTAQRALAYAIKAGYLVQRPGKRRSSQYALRWHDRDFGTRTPCGALFDCQN